ncbi:hypothetical protein N7468_001859 [Penicillium chermesinum]|uniref:Mcm2 3 5 family protein n=1 Tax=Penicillium chermesinum TaxID=63820 RepID=A0A9W9TWY3_9EURO|nr:uncharacterized protein N7468_001859 [Penicillium chermesinum]KAJ5246876.1 hypothetical protein N7468_001859 [Penicillium chermesinum]
MADSRESQHSLLPEEEDLVSQPWHPLGRSSSEDDPIFIDRESFSDSVFREVGLGISQPSPPPGTLPRGKRDSYLSSGTSQPSQPTTPGFLKTPQETPGLSPGLSQTHPVHLPNCPTRESLFKRRISWIPVTILILAFYATCGAGTYLVIAIWGPRWKSIGSTSGTAPSTANLLCAFFAKTIELAYVTICVAFLGQVLSRRALTKNSRGISLADMSMRTWIMQPGSMIVHWQTLRYSALTFLGMIALVASFVAMLYTTAAEALVSPKLIMGPVEDIQLYGQVSASFANTIYLERTCQTPISVQMDPYNRNLTCFDLEHVGSAYHNYQQWISNWAGLVEENPLSDNLYRRPPPTGSIWDNTTVIGAYIEIQNMTELSKKHGRFVQNVTTAFPHGNVPRAAFDGINQIRQPVDASGGGKYNIEAAVPSPAMNVLCAGMTAEELAPIVYTAWPNSSDFNATTWSVKPSSNIPVNTTWYNSTVVDDLFGFGEKYGQQPRSSGRISSPEYVLCAIRAKETGKCSTSYRAASSGAVLFANCDEDGNKYQYNKHDKNFKEGIWSADYKNVVGQWASSVSLGSGITGADASSERLIMQMMPSYDNATDSYSLSPQLPSIGEALSGWNYSGANDMLDEPVYQHFPAALQAMVYASGETEKWQGIFYVILVFAFLTSAIVFVFLIFEARGHQVTDFTEPQNLFAIAVNSPLTTRLDGACGCGPVGRQLKERWYIGMEEEDSHFYIRAKADKDSPYGFPSDTGKTSGYSRFDNLEVEESSLKPASPAANDYRRLSRQTSWLGRFY